MTPYLVTAPAAQPVSLAEMKAHLRVAHSDDDTDISAKIAGVTAHLDAWGGALGRCIMPQTWAVDATGKGPHLLPFPEASDVTVTGVSGPLDATVKRSFAGPLVTVADAADDEELVIEFQSGMDAARLPAAQSLIKLMVQREFDALSGPEAMATDSAIAALMNSLRWRRV